ncbi:helix-turn-helix domain-containing protein [Dysgonomonas sp. ZJ279]|uniref:helix-turn-helix domain-containing protein n=1 Tax=Dysgonomonas sp. ZJ279 TaxID=2709796 RepID=UPI0013EC0C9C|nr:helix-turn-helix transcriptional regulator [Dysgonomonas sp. ZJ279]
MKTENLSIKRVHHGHNIRDIRRGKGIKQEAMADMVHLSQQTVSRYESAQVIDDEMLERFAKALDVSVEEIKTTEEETNNNYYIENNTFSDSSSGILYNYTPVKEIIELCNQKVELYERLLEVEKGKITWLEKILEQKK